MVASESFHLQAIKKTLSIAFGDDWENIVLASIWYRAALVEEKVFSHFWFDFDFLLRKYIQKIEGRLPTALFDDWGVNSVGLLAKRRKKIYKFKEEDSRKVAATYTEWLDWQPS